MSFILNSVLQSSASNDYFEGKLDGLQAQLISEIKNGADVSDIAYLLQSGASKNRMYEGETPLSAAMNANSFSVFSYLIDNLKADIEQPFKHLNGKEYSLIWHALWENKMPYFKLLLNQGKKNIRDAENSQTLLIAAVKLVNPEAVSHCLNSNKMDVNDVDMYRRTALHYALSVSQNQLTEDHQKIITMLINAGANPELKDIDNNKPLDISAKMTELENLQIKAEMEMQNKAPKNNKTNKNKYGINNKKRGLGVK